MNTNYPSVGFYFQVLLDNQTFSFKEVSGISADTTTEKIADERKNHFNYKIPQGVKYNNLELKRGLVSKNSNLYTWLNNTITLGLNEQIKPKTLDVSLLNEDGNIVMSWSFIDVWPVGWNSSSIDSLDNEVLIESIKISYDYFANKIIK